jgi:hypothetical protein
LLPLLLPTARAARKPDGEWTMGGEKCSQKFKSKNRQLETEFSAELGVRKAGEPLQLTLVGGKQAVKSVRVE